MKHEIEVEEIQLYSNKEILQITGITVLLTLLFISVIVYFKG